MLCRTLITLLILLIRNLNSSQWARRLSRAAYYSLLNCVASSWLAGLRLQVFFLAFFFFRSQFVVLPILQSLKFAFHLIKLSCRSLEPSSLLWLVALTPIVPTTLKLKEKITLQLILCLKIPSPLKRTPHTHPFLPLLFSVCCRKSWWCEAKYSWHERHKVHRWRMRNCGRYPRV